MKHVAFLRAINVGGHIVKMDQLKRLFESMGFSNVETFIASGNVIFDARTTTVRKVEAALAEALGYEVRTFLRTPQALAQIAATKLDANCTLYVGLLAEPPSDEAKRKVEALSTDVDTLHVIGSELYWVCRRKFSDSTLTGAMLEKALGQKTTIRNITTIRRIAAKYPPK